MFDESGDAARIVIRSGSVPARIVMRPDHNPRPRLIAEQTTDVPIAAPSGLELLVFRFPPGFREMVEDVGGRGGQIVLAVIGARVELLRKLPNHCPHSLNINTSFDCRIRLQQR